MRHHHGLVGITVALLCALSTSTTTVAEEALPVVHPKQAAAEAIAPDATSAALLPDAPTVDLPSEPLRDLEPAPMTLAEAARANDYAAFDAAYQRAASPAYRELHALWTFAVTDPVGGFYGEEMHERLARAYPRYAAYIEDFRIVDSNGNVFYPSAETRAFLTEEAEKPLSVVRRPLAAPKRESVAVAPKPAAETAAVPAGETPARPVPAQPTAPVAQPAVRATDNGQRTTSPESPSSSRGILLIIIGLLGIGALTMMLRTPADEFTKVDAEAPAEPRASELHG